METRRCNTTRIYLDTAFVEGLHQVLDWKFPGGRDAMLQDPDPLFANLDHVRRLINVMRSTTYPSGTGFEGMSTQQVRSTQYYP